MRLEKGSACRGGNTSTKPWPQISTNILMRTHEKHKYTMGKDLPRQAPAPPSSGEAKDAPATVAWRGKSVRLWLAALVVLGGTAAGAYFAYDQYRTSQLALTVRQLFAARHYDQARELLRRWLAERPGSAEAHYYEGWLALALDRPRDAIEAIERAKKLGYDPEALACLIAIYQVRAGHTSEAEPVLERAFRQQREPRLEVAKELAKLYLGSYRLAEAAEPTERARLLAPEDPQPYLWVNEIASRGSGEPAILIQNYRAALERNPNLDKARMGLAEQLSKDRRFDDAEQEYRAYLERNPKDASALVGLGRNSFQRGDLDTANQYFEAALKADPRQPDALKELGQIDLRLGRFQKACERLGLLTEIQPFDYEVRYSYAQALKLGGDPVRSRIETEHAARLRKEQDHILQLRSKLLTDPNNSAIRFEVAKWMLENGHDEPGLKWTAEILRAEPRHAPTHRLLADYYQKHGNPGQANYHRLMDSTTQEK
jgi:tetratricopeptide (TPR) repeat protein